MESFTSKLAFPLSIHIGFAIWGAGNMGDDLMLSGFLQAVHFLTRHENQEIRIFCHSEQILSRSQSLRFPEVIWSTDLAALNSCTADEKDCWWIGVGSTAFQLSSGDWALRYLENQQKTFRYYSRVVMVAVGAENEAKTESLEFAKVVGDIDFISTRDQFSADIITNYFLYSDAQIFAGADLANICLAELSSGMIPKREYDLGLIIYGESMTSSEIEEICRFVDEQQGSLAFIACDVRPEYEEAIFAQISSSLKYSSRKKVTLLQPSYETGALADLIEPISRCKTIISSRYHGLLTAAWLGCRIAGIGRCSKIAALTDILGVVCNDQPITALKLSYLKNEAKVIPRHLLLDLRHQAMSAVRSVFARHL